MYDRVYSFAMEVCSYGCVVGEGGGEYCWRRLVAVECGVKVEVEVGDAWIDASGVVGKIEAWWRDAERRAASVDDRRNQVECFDYGAFAGVVFSDYDGGVVERDGVVVKTPVVLEAE